MESSVIAIFSMQPLSLGGTVNSEDKLRDQVVVTPCHFLKTPFNFISPFDLLESIWN